MTNRYAEYGSYTQTPVYMTARPTLDANELSTSKLATPTN